MKRILLFLFILVSLSQARASDTLTIRQVFNFNVGDTFDYQETTFNQCYNFFVTPIIRKVVIQKSYSISQDTIYYQYNFPQGNYYYTGAFFNTNQFDTITNLDDPAISLLSPDTAGGCTLANYDTTTYFGYTSDSETVYCFESAGFSRLTNRLGVTYSSLLGGGDPCGSNGNTYELIHFANDSMHFGYDILDGVADLLKKSEVTVFPSPTSDLLHLSISNASQYNIQFILTDLLGQEVYSSPITQSETTHDISKLVPGIYTWRVLEENSIIKTGKVVKE